MSFLRSEVDFTFSYNPLTYGPIGQIKYTKFWSDMIWNFPGFYFLLMVLDSSECNFLRPQPILAISTTDTHYSFLPDLLLSSVIYLKLTWYTVDFFKFLYCL